MKLTAFNRRLVLMIIGIEHGWRVTEAAENVYFKRGPYDLVVHCTIKGGIRWFMPSHFNRSAIPSTRDKFTDCILFLQRHGALLNPAPEGGNHVQSPPLSAS